MKIEPATREIEVEVAAALPDRQWVRRFKILSGSTVDEIIRVSRVLDENPSLQRESTRFGIHGRVVALETVALDGDRLECYRPLTADPKLARRKRAAKRRK